MMCQVNASFNSCDFGESCENNECVCSKGWVTGQEFLFLIDKVSSLEVNTPCTLNKGLLRFLYIVLLLLSIYSIVYYSRATEKTSQVKRLGAFFLFCSSLIIISIFKLVDIETGIGVDIPVTIFFSSSLLFFNFSVYIFLSKYYSYHSSTFKIKKKRVRNLLSGLRRVGEFVLLLNIIPFLFPLIVAAKAPSKDSSLKVMSEAKEKINQEESFRRLFMVFCCCVETAILVYQITATQVMVFLVRRDLKRVNQLSQRQAGKPALQTLKLIQISTAIAGTLGLIYLLVPATGPLNVKDSRFPLLQYLYPLAAITALVCADIILYANTMMLKNKTIGGYLRHIIDLNAMSGNLFIGSRQNTVTFKENENSRLNDDRSLLNSSQGCHGLTNPSSTDSERERRSSSVFGQPQPISQSMALSKKLDQHSPAKWNATEERSGTSAFKNKPPDGKNTSIACDQKKKVRKRPSLAPGTRQNSLCETDSAFEVQLSESSNESSVGDLANDIFAPIREIRPSL